ncbi:MAG: ThuA domain-containing protein [Verrucomicrobiota bacterium]|nr:ThuA domain-containing protein [Verrucomicrobiota bacterium]
MKSKISFLAKIAMIAALLLPIAATTLAADKPKKLLVVTATQGFRHSSIPLAEKVLAGLGETTGIYTVDYVRGGADGKSDADVKEKMTAEALKQYDGIVFANTTGDLPMPDKQALIDFVNSGKGFIGMHSASDTFHNFRPFIEMIGGEFLTHGEQATVDCINQHHDHPATKHLGAKYTVHDEIYILKNFHREKVHGLLTLDKHPNTKSPGDYPIAWTKQIGKGRLFYTSLGHREDVWTSKAYQDHILGGIKWALGLEKADTAPQKTSAALTPEEKKAGFKPLFNGENLDGWKHRNENGLKSWSVQNGMLVNTIPKDQHGTDLVSEKKFRDFTVRYEYMVPKGANSGFYLRGRHEIQVFDDGDSKEPKLSGNGAIYNIKPASTFVSRKAGEWQEVEATMIGNKVTVYLNGVKIHDQVEVNKATGSELDANLDQPGSFFLQGDHGEVAFRNIRVKTL